MPKHKKNTVIVNEPQSSYASPPAEKEIHFFSSLKEQEDDHYLYLASLSPQQHLENTMKLIRRIFSKELSTPKRKNYHITFNKNERTIRKS
jgi:hypothetical protein